MLKWISFLVSSRNLYWSVGQIISCICSGQDSTRLGTGQLLGEEQLLRSYELNNSHNSHRAGNVQDLTESMERPSRTEWESNKDPINAKLISWWPALPTTRKSWNCPHTSILVHHGAFWCFIFLSRCHLMLL